MLQTNIRAQLFCSESPSYNDCQQTSDHQNTIKAATHIPITFSISFAIQLHQKKSQFSFHGH
jgi:hypothetical protein